MQNKKVFFSAGIVLYNPDISRLKENIAAIKPQVSSVVLVENGSEDTMYIEEFKNTEVDIIVNNKSMGIAYALNQIMQYAHDKGAAWALTLDQDSIAADNLIEEYKRFAKSGTGIVTCCINDRNFKAYNEGNETDGELLKYCITSGSLTNVEAVRHVGGFDNKMFIDWVDWDICLALRHAGYKIVRAAKTRILHELGVNTRAKVWHGHQLLITHRSEMRYYYICRNWIYLARKWKEISILKNTLICIKWILIVLLYDQTKWKSSKAQIKGFIDGFRISVKHIDNDSGKR